jgi:hypothetical protein
MDLLDCSVCGSTCLREDLDECGCGVMLCTGCGKAEGGEIFCQKCLDIYSESDTEGEPSEEAPPDAGWGFTHTDDKGEDGEA